MTENSDFYLKCRQGIERAFNQGGTVLVDALPALRKSTGVVQWAAESGEKLVVFTARNDLYDQLEKECEERGVSYRVLPSFIRFCSTGGREEVHGEKWANRFKQKYAEGYSARELHTDALKHFDEPLPCQQEGTCEFLQRLEEKDKEDAYDQYDILIGHYVHLFDRTYSESRHVVIDEFPGDSLLIELSSGAVNSAINQYLDEDSSLPFSTRDDLVGTRRENKDIERWLNETGWLTFDSVAENWNKYWRKTDAYGAILTRAILTSKKLGQWTRATLRDGTVIAQDKNGRVVILPPFPFSEDKTVVGLDGTPSVEAWRAILGKQMKPISVLNDAEKREWLGQLGLRLIQLAETPVPVNGTLGDDRYRDQALIEGITRLEGAAPFVITSKNAIGNLKLVDQNPEWESRHYGNLKGLNTLDGVESALIIGSPQPSDHEIQKWAALAGSPAVPAEDEEGNRLRGNKLDFGDVGNDILRGFRDNEVLQAAMRFRRQVDESDNETRVYIYSNAIPEWVRPEVWDVDIRRWDDGRGMSQVVSVLTSGEDWGTRESTTGEILEMIQERYGSKAKGYDQVVNLLHKLTDEFELIRRVRRQSYVWSNLRLEERGKHCVVAIAPPDR
ncbi:hypothetical protein [Halobellus rufus]|uniref:hypothetical protein n=1 Tax=Halobellus rufus TaxID=1448860 RepID=UPI000678D12C|nr:hypothetical protein [Halobellus rufus]